MEYWCNYTDGGRLELFEKNQPQTYVLRYITSAIDNVIQEDTSLSSLLMMHGLSLFVSLSLSVSVFQFLFLTPLRYSNSSCHLYAHRVC